ncbi:hypothetical protein F383_37180 [Gossypium arboreum]|uniref:Uncharacterized protein n=1 Tax=Gossypium arboreum TaxID=29729 RepID=A0A0B0M6U4_GOSAR|nr:hypothetical protein F383_37180 [Gossypium arboreum]
MKFHYKHHLVRGKGCRASDSTFLYISI